MPGCMPEYMIDSIENANFGQLGLNYSLLRGQMNEVAF